MTICFETTTLNGLINDLELLTSDRDNAKVLLVGGKAIDLNLFPKLKGIFKTGVGTDNLPFEEAKVLGIEIQLPSPSTCQIIFDETADFACHLILDCLYRHPGDFASWTKKPRPSLAARQLLVVGTGRIGSIVREKMGAFCSVSTFDSQDNSPSDLKPLMKAADCVSLHLPLTDTTRGFMDQEKLRWMKDGAALVNTSRGPIVDEDAVYAELRSGRIFAALDVFWQEPYKGKLTELPSDSVLLTPHVASTCQQFLEATANDFRAFVKRLEAETDKP